MFATTSHHQPTWRNWSGGVRFQPQKILTPPSVEELADIIARASRVRPVGSGHSFSRLVETEGVLVSLNALSDLLEVKISANEEISEAVCEAGITIRALGAMLKRYRLALPNQGDIDAQTLGGALATGTHGTGIKFGSLSTAITALKLIIANGTTISSSASENQEIFNAGRVSLGALGIVPEFTIQCVRAQYLTQRVWTMPVEQFQNEVDVLINGNQHFEAFWFPYANRVIAKTLNPSERNERHLPPFQIDEEVVMKLLSGVAQHAGLMLPTAQRLVSALGGQPDVTDLSHAIFPHKRSVKFNEMEYAVALNDGMACAQEIIDTIRFKRLPVAFPLEIRTVAHDDIWLSPFFERDSMTISVHQYAGLDCKVLFNLVEPIFWKYDGRPHWGKMHTCTAEKFRKMYPRWEDFLKVRADLDPNGKFLNDHLRGIFGIDK